MIILTASAYSILPSIAGGLGFSFKNATIFSKYILKTEKTKLKYSDKRDKV